MKTKTRKIRDRVAPSLQLDYLKSPGTCYQRTSVAMYCVPGNWQAWLRYYVWVVPV